MNRETNVLWEAMEATNLIEGINVDKKLTVEINNLVKESQELKNILGSICVKDKKKRYHFNYFSL